MTKEQKRFMRIVIGTHVLMISGIKTKPVLILFFTNTSSKIIC